MGEPIENEYFNWLCAKVLHRGTRSYYELLKILHNTEFAWVVPADRHRAVDGIELRTDFLREVMVKKDPLWYDQPCSVLEMFYAFAKRASFQTDRPEREWFWEFAANLSLDQFRHVADSDHRIIEEILYNFIWRQYDPSGYGGMFPMRQRPMHDQRKVEIWYQFCEYLEDRGLL